MFAEDFSPVVQWIECQIPVLMMGVRIPSGEQRKAFREKGFFCIIRTLQYPHCPYYIRLF